MESAAVLRSFHYSVGTVHLRSAIERPGMVPMHSSILPTSSKFPLLGLTSSMEILSSQTKRAGVLISCVKTSDTAATAKSDGSAEKSLSRGPIFPSGFEDLVLGVCDETQIAEVKMKIGDFEMHLKRNIATPAPLAAPPPPPVPSFTESAPAAPPSASKSSSEKSNPFTNIPIEKSRKLAALEASGASGYVLVASPTVGSFRKGRTVKGKKQPPVCKEGDVIQEGQTICYMDQFGTELPVKSDVAGEVIKILFNDGEAVGYGDPLIAVSPSFHDINIK